MLSIPSVRRASLAGAMLACLLSSTAFAAERFIVMAFDDVAVGSDAAAYNACSEVRLAKAAITGLQSAQRFALNDVQMFGGVTVQLPEYLTLIEVIATDQTTATRTVAESLSATSNGCAGADPDKALHYTYRASGETMKRTHPDTKVPADGGPRQEYAHVVFTVPNETVKDQFESWYFSCHMPEILERTGLVSGQRGVGGTGTGAIPPTETVGIYRIELPDDMTIADTRPGERAPGARNCETGRMMNGDLSRGYSYRAIGPRIEPKS